MLISGTKEVPSKTLRTFGETDVSHHSIPGLTVISATETVTIPLSLNEPRGLAFTPDGLEGWVAMAASNAVLRYDPVGGSETGPPITVGTFPEELVILDVILGPTPNNVTGHWIHYQ